MATSNLFEDIQDCLDAMAQAVDRCADEDCTVGQMWNDIDAGCQRLASLSAGDIDDDEDDEESGTESAPGELNFDDQEHADAFEDDDEVQS